LRHWHILDTQHMVYCMVHDAGLLRGVGWGGDSIIEKFNPFLTIKCKCYINVALSSNNYRVNK
jgi:hypothetical protein